MITLSTLTLTLITGAILPLLVAALTQLHASSAVKAVVNVVLAVVTACVATVVQADGRVVWQTLVVTGYAAYVASGSAHAHLWKPVGATDAVAELTRGVGVG